MYVLSEHDVNEEPLRLKAAWARPETFALVPEKSGVAGEWVDKALAQVPTEFNDDHFALLTSGSTGRPKLIVGQRARAERLVETLHDLQASEPVAETILALPLTYSYAFINQWLWATHHDRRLVASRGFGEADHLLTALSEAEAAMICLVGVQVPLLARHFAGKSFAGVIRVHFAGGRFPQEKLDIVRGLFPNASIYNNYGCAEAMPRLSLRRAEEATEAADIGRPLPGVELRSESSGDLVFRSPFGAVGYVDDAGFAAIRPDTWVRTGDLGEASDRGSWRLLGRAGEVFKRHGEKISLSSLLATVHHCWRGQAAFYREADNTGEEGHVLVLAPHCDEVEVRAVLRAFRSSHPRAHWPLRLESLANLPLLPNGKVDARAISAQADRIVHWYQRI
jgi:acyl-CoA synthetase (AMP-forming)/AMP-acid ligase II